MAGSSLDLLRQRACHLIPEQGPRAQAGQIGVIPHSAHELRTPIASALARTQRMIADLSEPNDRRRARDVEATLKRLSALAEKLMELSVSMPASASVTAISISSRSWTWRSTTAPSGSTTRAAFTM